MLEGQFHLTPIRVFCLLKGRGIHDIQIFMNIRRRKLIRRRIIYFLLIITDRVAIKCGILYSRRIYSVKIQLFRGPVSQFCRIIIVPLASLTDNLHPVHFFSHERVNITCLPARKSEHVKICCGYVTACNRCRPCYRITPYQIKTNRI